MYTRTFALVPRRRVSPFGVALAALVSGLLSTSSTTLLAQTGPNVDVWLDAGSAFQPGQNGLVHYSADPGSYVTLLRFSTDGHFTVVSPLTPNDRTRVSTSSERSAAFVVDQNKGIGHFFAIASRSRFDFSRYRGTDDSWDLHALTPDAASNPTTAIVSFARHITNGRHYSVAATSYQVGATTLSADSLSRSHTVFYDNNPGTYGSAATGEDDGSTNITVYSGSPSYPYLSPYDPNSWYYYAPYWSGPLYIIPSWRHHGGRNAFPAPFPPIGSIPGFRCPDGTIVLQNMVCPTPRGRGFKPRHMAPRIPTPPQTMPRAPLRHRPASSSGTGSYTLPSIIRPSPDRSTRSSTTPQAHIVYPSYSYPNVPVPLAPPTPSSLATPGSRHTGAPAAHSAPPAVRSAPTVVEAPRSIPAPVVSHPAPAVSHPAPVVSTRARVTSPPPQLPSSTTHLRPSTTR